MATSESMSDLLSAGSAATAGGGIAGQNVQQGVQSVQQPQAFAQQMTGEKQRQAIELAQAHQNLQTNMLKQQEMQQQLEAGKFKTTTGIFDTAMKMGPKIFKVVEPQLENQLLQANPNYQKGTLSAFYNDDDNKASWNAYAEARMTGKMPVDQEHMQLINNAIGMPGKLEELADSFSQQRKLEMEQKVAEIKGKYQVEAAGMRTGPMQERVQQGAARLYNSTMGKSEDAILAANKVQSIIKDVDAGTLNSNKTIKGEVMKNIAMLLSNGAPSTVYGEHAIEQDSIYERLKNSYNTIAGKAESTVAPEQWDQMKKDINALQANAAENHRIKYEGIREQLGPLSVAHADARYNKFRQNLKLPNLTGNAPAGGGGGDTATPSVAAPQRQQTGQLSANQQSYITKLQQAGLSPDAAMQRMQQKGIK